MIFHTIAFAVLLAVAHAGLLGGVGVVGTSGAAVDLYAPPKYEFSYAVGDPKTGDQKEQSEVRVGDVVKGQYSLAEPDGTIRVVKYTSDGLNGFNAIVERIGKAVHPQVLVQKSVGIPVGVSLGAIGLGRGLGGGLEGGLGRGLGGGLGGGLEGGLGGGIGGGLGRGLGGGPGRGLGGGLGGLEGGLVGLGGRLGGGLEGGLVRGLGGGLGGLGLGLGKL